MFLDRVKIMQEVHARFEMHSSRVLRQYFTIYLRNVKKLKAQKKRAMKELLGFLLIIEAKKEVVEENEDINFTGRFAERTE